MASSSLYLNITELPDSAGLVGTPGLGLPPASAMLINRAQELMSTSKTAEAVALLEAHYEESAGPFLWHRTLAFAYAEDHRPAKAMREVDIATALCPHDSLARALRHALESLQDPSSQLEYIVQRIYVAAEPPITALENTQLRRHILKDETLDWQDNDLARAIHGGWQTNDVSCQEQAFHPLEKAVRKASRELLARNGRSLALELGLCEESACTVKFWSVVLPPEGLIATHVHSADLSGVYYVDVPNAIAGGDEGALKFVTHPPELTPLGYLQGRQYLFRPRARNLIIFPSSFWHTTVPFEQDALRISVAFDITFNRTELSPRETHPFEKAWT